MNTETSQSSSSKSKRYSDRRRDDRPRKPAESLESVDQLSKDMSDNLHIDKDHNEEQYRDNRKEGKDNSDIDKRKNRVRKTFLDKVEHSKCNIYNLIFFKPYFSIFRYFFFKGTAIDANL